MSTALEQSNGNAIPRSSASKKAMEGAFAPTADIKGAESRYVT